MSKELEIQTCQHEKNTTMCITMTDVENNKGSIYVCKLCGKLVLENVEVNVLKSN